MTEQNSIGNDQKVHSINNQIISQQQLYDREVRLTDNWKSNATRIETELNEIVEKNDKIKEELQNAEKKNRYLSGECQSTKEILQDVQEKLTSEHEMTKKANSQIKDLTSESQTLKMKNAQHNSNVYALNEEIKGLQSSEGNKKQDVINLKKKIAYGSATADNKIKLEKMQNDARVLLDKTKKDIKNLEKRIMEMDMEEGERTQIMDSLQSLVGDLTKKVIHSDNIVMSPPRMVRQKTVEDYQSMTSINRMQAFKDMQQSIKSQIARIHQEVRISVNVNLATPSLAAVMVDDEEEEEE